MNSFLQYNKSGIIPGPDESEEDFLKRATYCLELKKQIPHMLSNELPFSMMEDHLADQILKQGCERARQLYDIFPQWVPLFFSNYKLPFWHGGCAWIFQHKQDTPTAAFFQLRQNFRHSHYYLGIYEREELISHELAHVGRMMFEEPKFEELLAYRSSKSWFRRFFGPIFQSSIESMIFFLLLCLIIVIDIFSIFYLPIELSALSWIGCLVLFGLIGFGLSRLCIRQQQLSGAEKKLQQLLSDTDRAKAVLYRLTDAEIIKFNRNSLEEIRKYAIEKQHNSPRWKVIYEAYFQ